MFIGHTRFSLYVPDSTAWRASMGGGFSNSKEYQNFLYSEERLDLRTEVFLQHTIPTLARAAEKFDVTHIVSFSESLPSKFKDKLSQAAADYPVVLLDELADGDSGFGSANRVAKEKGTQGVFGRYRLDDDDILSTSYFDLISKYIKPELVGMVVSLPLGVEVVLDQGGFFNFREAHVPMNSMGLLSICSLEANGSVRGPKGGPHDRSDRFDPVILDASGFGYLRCIHTGQDNAMRFSNGSVMEHLLQGMSKFPPATDFDLLEKSFPTVMATVGSHENSTTFEIEKTLEEDLYFEFESPSENLALVIEGCSEANTKYPALASLILVDQWGNRIPSYKTVTGIGCSKIPGIGHFMYIEEGKGDFKSLVSLHLDAGVKIKAFRIVGLSEHPERVQVRNIRVSHSAAEVRLLNQNEFNELQVNTKYGIFVRLADVIYRNRYVAIERLRQVVGERTTERITSMSAKLLGRLR